jgi:lipid-binding SYLF domain-containing protein
MKTPSLSKTLLFLCALAPAMFAAATPDSPNYKRIRTATEVFDEIMHAPDRGIPESLLKRAQCVGIVPDLKRAGFVFGAKYGKGVLVCRTATGRWSGPSVIRIEGGSIGFQIGAGETDLVFLVMNRHGEDKLMGDRFTVGGDATAMGGPVGRTAEAQTDAVMRAEILSWSRSHGVFAGVSLEGATLRPDNDDNWRLYGKEVGHRAILTGEVHPPTAAGRLYAALDRYVPSRVSRT